jgi:CubicO group peptidase (beta-lactamase class C family)
MIIARRIVAPLICAALLAQAGASAAQPQSQPAVAAQPAPRTYRAAALAALDPMFAEFARTAHAPGVVYGVVADGRLIYVKGLGSPGHGDKGAGHRRHGVPRGVHDQELHRPSGAEAARRRASSTSRRPRERRAGAQGAAVSDRRQPAHPRPRPALPFRGFVTDDPLGRPADGPDEAAFDAYLATAFPMSRAPQTAHEYSNTGYALLGRAIANASGRSYIDYVTAELLRPLGMESSSFRVADAPAARRAVGYRWQDDQWVREPELGDGPLRRHGRTADHGQRLRPICRLRALRLAAA